MTGRAATERARSRRGLAGGLGAFVAAEVVLGLVLSAMAGWGWQQMLDGFVVTNGLMGVTFGLCGAVIAWHQPGNPIGWLFIADGIGHATTTFAGPLGPVLAEAGAPLPAQRLIVTVAMLAWPWSIGLFLPLALLLFPTGRPLSPRWRWVSLGIIVTAPLFVIEMVASGEPISNGLPRGYLAIPSYADLQPLWTATELRNLVAILLATACLLIRYRRADEAGRRQLLWLLLASVVALLFITPWAFVTGTPIFVLLAIPLIPIAVAVAIVRYQLLDIRLVVSRALTWGLLTLVAIGSYAALAAVLGALIPSRVGRSGAVTVLVALIIAPILPRLRQLVDRALYGDRGDPARIASRVGEQLSAGLPGVVAAIRSGLRFPYTALTVGDDVIAADGAPPQIVVPLDLEYAGTSVAQLLVGLRSGESRLSAADRDVLALVAVPLAVAVHATRLSNELQSSREDLVTAREEERRRLRRDLHDGLGPTLTGIAFTADAAANLVDTEPGKSRDLLSTLRTDTRTAISDVRRLVDDLRPPALDELGLVGALRQRADQLTFRADGATIQVAVAADGLPALPAALEVAAYRIATEALTNVVRHSRATSAVLALRCGNDLEVEVTDDGAPNGAWRPGVGLHAMRERAAELGGAFEAGPTPTGGVVRARLPLGTR
ncbi:sensor histidine kinase [Kribbella sp. NPDC020789]